MNGVRGLALRVLERLLPASPAHDVMRLPPVRQRAFWAVQGLTLAIALVHSLLARNGLPEALHLVPVSLFFIPVVYAALKFGARGAIPTAMWSTILTIPDLVQFHAGVERAGIIWQGVILIAIGTFVGFAVDRERDARAEAEAREAARLASERRYRALYDRAADGVLVVDDQGRIEEANAAAVRLLGRDLAAVAGQSLADVLGPELTEDLFHGSADRSPRPLPREDGGSPAWVQAVGASPLTGGGDAGGLQVIVRDVTLAHEREQGLEGYARHAVAAREEERRRMAHELHDGPLQSLVLLLRKLDAIGEGADEEGALEDAREIIDETAAELRRLSRALRPPILDDLGLVAALRSEATAFGRRSGIDARFEVGGDVRPLGEDIELLLLRAAQETLHNAERHSAATTVRVALSYEPDHAALVVADDGRGMVEVPKPTVLLTRGKLGLLGLQERVRLAHGTVSIDTRPGQGTTVRVRVPTDLAA